MISVTVDISGAAASLSDLQKRQLPYATSRAINAVATSSRETLIALMPSIFRFRTGTQWIRRGGATHRGWFDIKFSTKTNLVAVVQTTFDFLYLQEFGGEKRGRGPHIAVPMGKLRLKKIPPQLRPKFVLGGKGRDLGGVLRAASLGPRSRKKQFAQFGVGFILKTNGKQFIARRVASASQAAGIAVTRPKHGTIDLMYLLVNAVHLHERMRMAPTIRNVVQREWASAFARELEGALRTAR
jgi:hypothetical protein